MRSCPSARPCAPGPSRAQLLPNPLLGDPERLAAAAELLEGRDPRGFHQIRNAPANLGVGDLRSELLGRREAGEPRERSRR